MAKSRPTTPAEVILDRLFGAGLRALDCREATTRAIAEAPPPGPGPVALLAVGKASAGMFAGASDALMAQSRRLCAGLIIGADPAKHPQAGVETLIGDHPIPGEASLCAAAGLANWLESLPCRTPLIGLISGGTSSLIAAPLPGITPTELAQSFVQLQRFGIGIAATNAARRRLTRWSGGRLRAALGSRYIAALLVSDVPGDAPATIGSGPLIGGTASADDVSPITTNLERMAALPKTVRRALRGPAPPRVSAVPHRVILNAAVARAAIAAAARVQGIRSVGDHSDHLGGDTATHAVELAALFAQRVRQDPTERLDIWATEMTVTMACESGLGGRCQQFALELGLALERHRLGSPGLDRITVLVAGTDGRDGPTDAAGAWSDSQLPGRLRAMGFAPEVGAKTRDSYRMLDQAGALYRTGQTGTNVADILLVFQSGAN